MNLVLDGATGAIVQTYRHPDPQKGSISASRSEQPAIGNAGGSAIPDIFVPAAGQDTDKFRGKGIGYLMNGATLLSGNIVNLERFRPQSRGIRASARPRRRRQPRRRC